jgi:hypothetical protein
MVAAAAADRDSEGNKPACVGACVQVGNQREGVIAKVHRSGGVWQAGFCKNNPPLSSAFRSKYNVSDWSFHSLHSYLDFHVIHSRLKIG